MGSGARGEMSGYQTKVYVVQQAERDGALGPILAVKLSHTAAHAIAKRHAPAKVHFVIADKSEQLNVALVKSQSRRN